MAHSNSHQPSITKAPQSSSVSPLHHSGSTTMNIPLLSVIIARQFKGCRMTDCFENIDAIPMHVEYEQIDLMELVDNQRITANLELNIDTKSDLGQFMTPKGVAKILAKLCCNLNDEVNILDAGAGVASLTSSVIEEAITNDQFEPIRININCWEIDPIMFGHQEANIALVNQYCDAHGIELSSNLVNSDFIQQAVTWLKTNETNPPLFTTAILNPPYLKIKKNSQESKLLESVGINTTNLYSGFVSLALKLLEPQGELIAITPRSFCNGPYFSEFRRLLLDGNNLTHISVFESRKRAFKEDKVLQENVIFRIVKAENQGDVVISSYQDQDDMNPQERLTPFDNVVFPSDKNNFIHITTNDEQADIATRIALMPCSLSDLNIQASTGKVVDFRTPDNLRDMPGADTVPLIFPMHFNGYDINWPKVRSVITDTNKKKLKPNALALNDKTRSLVIPNGYYVLTKRLTSKEEKRRVVAAVYSPIAEVGFVGFDNKTNYFHANGEPLEETLAYGLWCYLNTNIFDNYFRQFNGHTQVNATDLRFIRYPDSDMLQNMGLEVIGCIERNENIEFDQILDLYI